MDKLNTKCSNALETETNNNIVKNLLNVWDNQYQKIRKI